MLKRVIRSLTPAFVLKGYHLFLARLAAMVYRYPSDELVVIGVTGTNGKSSTTAFLGRLLSSAGYTVGWTSTAGFHVAGKEVVNDTKMTMLGRFRLQRMLREMVRAGCTHVVVETSSQGIDQYRHLGVNYDVAVFTNLTPEHIEAHGGFENYKHAKGKLFSHTAKGKMKTLRGQEVTKTAVVNIDDEHAAYFLSFGLSRQYGYGLGEASRNHEALKRQFIPVLARSVEITAKGSRFSVEGVECSLRPIGRFNVYNALAALTAARAVGVGWKELKEGVAKLEPVPGRMEPIDEGQPFSVIVDYAYEPYALEAIYETLELLSYNRLIHITGSAGGGRDQARREIIGKLAAERDDVVIVTNEDPYDEPPMEIIDAVADAAAAAGKIDGETLHRILDRQEAIDFAVELAEPDDLVLITGKGSEPVMAVENGRKIPWDDREAVRAALRRLTQAAS